LLEDNHVVEDILLMFAMKNLDDGDNKKKRWTGSTIDVYALVKILHSSV
jgi:hypothetical protein